MKKYVIGCGISAVLLLGIGAIALWFFVLKPAAQLAGNAVDGAREGLGRVTAIAQTVQTMRAMDEKVTNQGSYAPPTDAHIDAGQITRFVAVQNAVIAVLGPEFETLETTTQSGGILPIAEGLTALARLGTTGIAAKTAQVEALNAQGMSLSEYRWIRNTAIATLVAGGLSTAWIEAQAFGDGVAGAALDAARNAVEATTNATEGIGRMRQAAEAASAALRGEKPASQEATQEPSALPPSTTTADNTSISSPAVKATVQQANLVLVTPHVETFTRAKLLATLGL